MNRIKKIFHDISTICFFSSYSLTQKIHLLFDYCKIITINFLHGRVMKVKEVRFLGYTWKVKDMGEFCWLVSEIFIEEPYMPKAGFSKVETVCDCGSNIGMSILYFKYKKPTLSIVGFEPDPEIYEQLQKNLLKNDVEDVTVHNVALSDKEGEATFYIRNDLSIASSSLSVDPDKTHEITVPTKCLSKYLQTPVDYLKMDIQFSEAKVFSELGHAGVMNNIKEMIMEYHYRFDVHNNNLSVILGAFEGTELDYIVKLGSDKPGRFRTYIISAECVQGV